MEVPEGFIFPMTDEQIVDDYLRSKNLEEDTSRVDQFFNTVTICNFEPWELPEESKYELKEREWCFFGRKENKFKKGKIQNRSTKCGFWKRNGHNNEILRKSSGDDDDEKIGEKRFFIFIMGKETRSEWFMHEYHLLSSDDQVMEYSFCKLIFKGLKSEIPSTSLAPAATEGLTTVTEGFKIQELQNPSQFSDILDREIPSSSSDATAATEIEHSLVSHVTNSGGLTTVNEISDILDEHQQAEIEAAIRRALESVTNDDLDRYHARCKQEEKDAIASMQEYRNDFTCQSSGCYTSDSISQSVTTGSIETLSTSHGFGSLNHRIDQIKDPQESSPSSTVTLTQEVTEAVRTSVDPSEEEKNKKTTGDDDTQESEKREGA